MVPQPVKSYDAVPNTVLYLTVIGVLVHCTVGWVNFSEFEITVCGSCKMSTTKKFLFCENP